MCNVILIDDDKNQLFLNTILLQSENIFKNIRSFHNPLQAIDFVKTTFDVKNDIIVLDINMPQMTAWEFLSSINLDLDEKEKLDLNLFIASHSTNPKDIKKANEHVLVNKFIDKFLLVDEITRFAKTKQFRPQRLASK